MLDAGFTYGGQCLGVVALVLWAWLAAAALPASHLLSRYEDDLQLGQRSTEGHIPERHFGYANGLGRIAIALTVVAIAFQSIGFAIPD